MQHVLTDLFRPRAGAVVAAMAVHNVTARLAVSVVETPTKSVVYFIDLYSPRKPVVSSCSLRGMVSSLSFSPSGDMIAIATSRIIGHSGLAGETHILNHPFDGTSRVLVSSRGFPHSVSFACDGSALAVSSQETTLWDTTSWRVTGTIRGRSCFHCLPRFSKDGQSVALVLPSDSIPEHPGGSVGRIVGVYGRDSGREEAVISWYDTVVEVQFTADNRQVLTCGNRKVDGDMVADIALWDLGTASPRTVLPMPVRPVSCMAVAGDERVVAAGCLDTQGSVYVWEVNGTSAVIDMPDAVRFLSFVGDRNDLVAAMQTRGVALIRRGE
jgi:hypothetical protein